MDKKRAGVFVLAADIGATTARFGIYSSSNLSKPTKTLCLPTQSVSLRDAMTQVKGLVKSYAIQSACFAVAGPVKNNKAELVNASWSFSAPVLRSMLNIKHVFLVNDFVAVATAIPYLKKDQYRALMPNKPKRHGTIRVIGAGTGLGSASLHYDSGKQHYVTSPSEDGHSSFSVETGEDAKIFSYLQKRNKGKMVYKEDVLSGRGVENLFRYFAYHKKRSQSSVAKDILKSSNPAVTISKLRKRNALCKMTYQLLTTYYARYARDCLLQSLPTGGLYIAGGIAQKNQDIMTSSLFKQELYKSHVHQILIRSFPVMLVTDPFVGLNGAARVATRGEV